VALEAPAALALDRMRLEPVWPDRQSPWPYLGRFVSSGAAAGLALAAVVGTGRRWERTLCLAVAGVALYVCILAAPGSTPAATVALTGLVPAEEPPATLVFLDTEREPLRLRPGRVLLSPESARTLERRLGRLATPESRAALTALMARAQWDWDAEVMLRLHRLWLESDPRGADLKAAVRLLRLTPSSPERRALLDSLCVPGRFFFSSHDCASLAVALREEGREREAAPLVREVLTSYSDDHMLQRWATPVRGRLLLDGKPLAGTRLCALRGKKSETMERSMGWLNPVALHGEIVDRTLPGPVTRTDREGRFQFSLWPYEYNGVPVVRLEMDADVRVVGGYFVQPPRGSDLGTLELRTR
ncbi:MAG: hypothetical protein AB1758_21120, partial [Candidatus Eremiobacterota bacterium]